MSQARSSGISFGDRILDRLKLQFLSAMEIGRQSFPASGLPDDVQAVIRQVVSQTGLLRFEKAEIARELINHFLDGRDRDRTWESLVEDFGEIDVAVSLFRSSKLRSRPMSVKAFRGSFYALSAGLLGYLMLQLFFHSAVPTPSVDYGAMLNEAVTSAPIELQAWPHYRELYIKHGFNADGESFRKSFQDIYVEGDGHLRLARPSDKQWSAAVHKLESLEELLDAWRKYSELPHLGTPLHVDLRKYSDIDLKVLFPNRKRVELGERNVFGVTGLSEEAVELLDGSVMGVLLPHIQNFREATRLLHVDTRLAVTQGDQNRAVANIKAIHGLARQAADTPMFVCSLVGRAMHGIGFGVIEEVIVEDPDFLDEDHLLELQQYVDSLELPDLQRDAEFEQCVNMDLIQRIYSDDGNGDGRITAVGSEVQFAATTADLLWSPNEESSWYDTPFLRPATAPISLFSAPTRKEMENLIDDSWGEWSKRMQRPMWEAEDSDWAEYLKEQDDSGLLLTFLGGFGNLKDSREVQLAHRDAILLALACHRYHKANHEWPTSLDQLVGKWLKDTPIDRINGEPLKFRIKENAPVIYSVGQDGDDDGGVNPASGIAWRDKNVDGDWILWPQTDL